MHAFPSRFVNVIRRSGAAIVVVSAAFAGATNRTAADCGTIVGDRWIHVVASGETWTSIGARAGVDPAVLAARNERTLRTPLRPGDVLGIDNRHIAPPYDDTGLIVNVPQRMLFHYWEGELRAHYPIAVGRADWQTPLGSFTILATETDPTWDVPISIQEEMRRAGKPVVKRVPPGPANPLGRYWLGLSLGSVGLHGTNAPSSIFHFATHGCIRLHPEDIEELFHRVSVGERGLMVYEPVLVAFDGTDVFVEVHRDMYRRAPDSFGRAIDLLERAGLRDLVDPGELVRVIRNAEGLAVTVTRR
jgi:L,D-transpeptidase ErfK/SrfK